MDYNIYKEKLSKLPAWVQDYLDSTKAGEYNGIICDKYRLHTLDDIHKYMGLVNKIFFKELMLVSLFKEIKTLFGFDDDQARQMAVDIAGIKCLAVADWLDKDVHQYITDLGGNPDDYEIYVKQHDQSLEAEASNLTQEFNEEIEADEDNLFNSTNIKETEGKVKDVFAKQIVDLLHWDDESVISDVNYAVMFLLDRNDQVFKNELLNVFLENQEIITGKKFVMAGKDTIGSVGNWLKDFISQHGSGAFDIVALSDFINNSENGRILDDEEKDIVSKILITYRNLKFFPDVFSTGHFEIIPQQNNQTEMQLSHPESQLSHDDLTKQKIAPVGLTQPQPYKEIDFGKVVSQNQPSNQTIK
jgi:hypothetical protein